MRSPAPLAPWRYNASGVGSRRQTGTAARRGPGPHFREEPEAQGKGRDLGAAARLCGVTARHPAPLVSDAVDVASRDVRRAPQVSDAYLEPRKGRVGDPCRAPSSRPARRAEPSPGLGSRVPGPRSQPRVVLTLLLSSPGSCSRRHRLGPGCRASPSGASLTRRGGSWPRTSPVSCRSTVPSWTPTSS